MRQLTFRTRLFYGLGGLSMVLPDLMMIQWLTYRYVPPDAGKHLLPPALFGVLFLAGRMTEGLSCPVLGHWSDTCTHRWGRRLPFMRYGIAPYLIAFFMLFNPPFAQIRGWNILYVFVFMEIYFFLYTVLFTPYLALLPELTGDLKERVDLTTIQAIFIMAAAFIFGSLGAVLEHGGWRLLSLCAALIILASFAPALMGLREKPATAGTDALGLRESIRLTLANRPFRYLVVSTSCYFFGLNGMLLLLPYWVRNYLGGGESDVTWLMLPYLAVSVPCFLGFNALVPRFGKRSLLFFTFLATGGAMVAFALAGAIPLGSPFLQSGVIMALLGVPVAGFMMLPYAALADVIDYDEIKTGRRREAVYFGVQGVVQKAFMGLSVVAATLLPYFDGAHFVSSPTPLGMRLMACLCGVMCLAGFLVFTGYPIREKGGKAVFPE